MNNELTTTQPSAINPFVSKGHALATVEVESQRAVAEVQAAMMLARRFPRDPIAAMDRILNACTRPSLAEGALYTYSRGGSDISGPSIRLAEAMAQSWGNIQFGIRELEQRSGESTVEAFAWDVETNTRQVKVFQVPHVRHTKQGQKRLEDPRDIYELVANQGARRLRACILGVIPGDVTEEAVKQCETTLASSADVSPENVKKMLAVFEEKFGVTKEQIETRIQRRIESMQPAQMVALKKIYASLNDGMSKPEDWFGGNASGETPSLVKKPTEKPVEPTKPAPEIAAEGLADENDQRNALLDTINEARDTDNLPIDKVRKWAFKNGLAMSEKTPLPSLPTASLRAIVERWSEIVAA